MPPRKIESDGKANRALRWIDVFSKEIIMSSNDLKDALRAKDAEITELKERIADLKKQLKEKNQ